MKFAYIIFAHDNFKVLERLVSMLDDPRNDIFVHIDKKVKEVPALSTSYSRLVFIENRNDIRWGTYSLIKGIVSILDEVITIGKYDYFHLISGTTLPVKSQDYIHSYFESVRGSSVFRVRPCDEGETDFKIRRIHFWINNFQSKDKWKRTLTQRIWTLNMFIQRVLGVRINKNEQFYKSEVWSSLTESAVKYLVNDNDSLKRIYHHCFTGDEFFQLSELKKNNMFSIVDNQYLIYATFENDHPKCLSKIDYEHLFASKYLFARKFTDNTILSL